MQEGPTPLKVSCAMLFAIDSITCILECRSSLIAKLVFDEPARLKFLVARALRSKCHVSLALSGLSPGFQHDLMMPSCRFSRNAVKIITVN